ncbi:MAG: EamA family transporter [Sutterella sp.]|nr:EamA family transporter [Sutterella sp.]
MARFLRVKRENKMLNEKTAKLGVLLTALIWSSGGLAVKIANCPADALTGWRCFFCLVLFVLFYRKEKLLTFSKAQWAGAIAYFLMAYFYIAATQLTTAANAILLQYTAPVYVALLSIWLLKEKVKKKDWFVIAAVFLGMILFFVDKAGIGNMLGNVLGVLSGISFATFIVCTRMQKNAHPAGSIFLGNVIALVVCLPSMIVTPLTEDAIFGGMYLGLIYGGLSYIIYSACIRYVSALSAILIATIEPVLNPVWVFFLVGETPSSYAILGGGIVVVSILIGNLTGLCKKERK